MAPKMMSDADGDTPPCSALWSLEGAQAWDMLKQEKYRGTQKAHSMVETFKKMELRHQAKTATTVTLPANSKKSWWSRLICPLC
jgi:hypothetical protein